MDKVINNMNEFNSREKGKTAAYYMTIMTICLFVFSEVIYRGPFFVASKVIDGLKLKYVFLFLTCGVNLMLLARNGKRVLRRSSVYYIEAKAFIKAIGVLLIITIIMQVQNGFRSFSYIEFAYLLLPLGFSIILVATDYECITRILDNSFYIVTMAFIISYLDILTPANILSISFVNSYSPFENSNSLMYVCFELYFLVRYGGRNHKSFICLLLTILTFKRIVVIKAILIYVFVPMLKKKSVPKWLFWSALIVFCILPIGLQIFYSDSFATMVSSMYNIDMNQLTMDRYRRTNYVLDNLEQIKYGYGSVTYFLTHFFGTGIFENRSLHCDILRIYLECTIIGTIGYNYFSFSVARNNIISFILMFHIFTEMVINHPIGAGCVGNWIILYMMIIYFNYRDKIYFYKEGKLRRKRFKIGRITR